MTMTTMTTASKHWVRKDHTVGSVAHARKAVEIQLSLKAGVLVVVMVVMHAGKQAGHEALCECGGLVNLKTVGRRK